MSFNPTKEYEQEYRRKLKNYLDYLYKVNFANGLYVDMTLLHVEMPIERYRVYVGKGNNNMLLKQLLKRRFWYEVVSSSEEECRFYWTQYPLKGVIDRQTARTMDEKG